MSNESHFMKMVSNSIKIFARIKRERTNDSNHYEVTQRQHGNNGIIIYKNTKQGQDSSRFRFSNIFDQYCDQEELFDKIAKPIVNSVLQGFNGTIFAYGQTGSGKTYSMTGSSRKYKYRGIIPRSLEYIFSILEQVEEKPIMYISYVEIYNEACYDLLNSREKRIASKLEELPKVVMLEDGKGELHLRNVSVLPVVTEEEAMRLLFLGETNRAIAETPLNEYSSRSHCIFTVYLTFREKDSDTLRKSKLNFVDLAGSERVCKSKNTGSTLTEAKYINRSLHFLQQVILALSESRRSHVPYRNSIMTFMLKDSLVGNCLTVMLATLSFATKNIQESISTCIFAQRVSSIKTEPIVNEIKDPQQEINMLRSEILELRRQLSELNGRDIPSAIKNVTEEEKLKCEKYIEKFINSNNLDISIDRKLYGYSLLVMKNKLLSLKKDFNKLKQSPKMIECKPTELYEEKVVNSNLLKQHADDYANGPVYITAEKLAEVNYYEKLLANTLEKAKLYSETITFCQTNISCIREKIEICSKNGNSQEKLLLGKDLEYQQTVYMQSINELKELKRKALILEAGMNKAQKKIAKTRNDERNENTFSHNQKQVLHYGYCNCYNNCQNEDEYYDYQEDSSKHISDDIKYNKICCAYENYVPMNYELHKPKSCCLKSLQHISPFSSKPQQHSFNCAHLHKLNKLHTHALCGQSGTAAFDVGSHNTKSNYRDADSSNDIVLSRPSEKHNLCSLIEPRIFKKEKFDVDSDAIQLIPDKLDKELVIHNSPSPDYQEYYNGHNIGETFNEFDNVTDKKHESINNTGNNILINKSADKYNIFLSNDSENFKEFIKTVPLTGDEDVDREICNFYRSKLS